MKKLLLTAAAISVLSSASAGAMTMDDSFYIKANVGGVKLNKVSSGGSYKSKVGVYLGLGAGYMVMENTRFDLMFNYYFNPKFKNNNTYSGSTIKSVGSNNSLLDGLTNLQQPVAVANIADDDKLVINKQIKAKIYTLMVNGYYDVVNVDSFKVFVGLGLGAGQASAKLTTYTNMTDASGTTKQLPSVETGNANTAATLTTITKAKRKTNVAYAAHLGLGYECTQGVDVELTYSYKYLGKSGKLADMDATGAAKTKALTFKGHHITAGVKFDL